MKITVWLENKVDQELEVEVEPIINDFKNYLDCLDPKDTYWPMERKLAVFLSCYKIRDKWFVWDNGGFRKILRFYEENK